VRPGCPEERPKEVSIRDREREKQKEKGGREKGKGGGMYLCDGLRGYVHGLEEIDELLKALLRWHVAKERRTIITPAELRLLQSRRGETAEGKERHI
jgi:hypothetical protein